MAAMTDLALVESRQQVEDELRGTFLEELRAGDQLEASEVIRRGERLGCDLSAGALILAGDPEPDRIHRFMAAIKAECPAAFVQRLDGRVYAVIPAGEERRRRGPRGRRRQRAGQAPAGPRARSASRPSTATPPSSAGPSRRPT